MERYFLFFLAGVASLAVLIGCTPDSDPEPTPTPPSTVDLYDDGETWRSFTPTTVSPGGSIDVYCDVRNGGNSASGSFQVRFYASLNTTITSSDYSIGFAFMGSISGGGYADVDLVGVGAVPSSIPPGTYYVGWIIDAADDVSETNESNNVAYKTGYQLTVIPTAPSIDLHDDGQSYSGFSPTTVTRGNTVDVWCDIRNSGTSSSGSFWVDFYLSTNTTISTGDTFIGSVYMSSISGGSWTDCDLNSAVVPLSMSPGTYYVGWIIDAAYQVAENDETNNIEYKQGQTLVVQ